MSDEEACPHGNTEPHTYDHLNGFGVVEEARFCSGKPFKPRLDAFAPEVLWLYADWLRTFPLQPVVFGHTEEYKAREERYRDALAQVPVELRPAIDEAVRAMGRAFEVGYSLRLRSFSTPVVKRG